MQNEDLKRQRMLLSATRKYLERKVSSLSSENNVTQPMFYSVKDTDGEPGLRITQGGAAAVGENNTLEFSGMINIHEDAPFVLTEIGATLVTSDYFGSVTGSGDNISLGFLDTSSGRYFFQANGRDVNNNADPTDPLLSAEMFDMFRYNDTVVGVAGGVRAGHGSLGGWTLPQEVVLPAAGAIQVLARCSTVPADPTAYRLYVTLTGYKVLS